MSLVTNAKSSLYGGVNQQSAEHRLETQVEECINAYPTVNQGLLKRNPTINLPLSGSVTFAEDNYIYSYDRGLAGDSEEKYAVVINTGGMEIINTVSGKVYTKANGLLKYETQSDEDYLKPFTNANSYSAVTIKDTTFIVNKNKLVQLDPYTFSSSADAQIVTKTLWQDIETFAGFSSQTPKEVTFEMYLGAQESYYSFYMNKRYVKTISQKDIPPSKLYSRLVNVQYGDGYLDAYVWKKTYELRTSRSIISINIDGTAINYELPDMKVGEYMEVLYNWRDETIRTFSFNATTYNEWFTNLLDKISASVDPSKYVINASDPYGVVSTSDKIISIERLDGVQPTIAVTLVIDPMPSDRDNTLLIDSFSTDYYLGQTQSQNTRDVLIPETNYKDTCFFWIKASEPTVGYSYTYLINDGVNSIGGTITNTTTEAVATDMAADINAKALGYTATASGSFVKVVSDNGSIVSLSISDTYGNQASFAWCTEVNSMYDLPKSFPFFSIVNVINTDIHEDSGYWLKYEGGIWRECLGFDVQPKIDASTMPHVLIRNSDDTFTFKKFDSWVDMQVGDSDTNKAPSFINTYIKDIFFFKNRLGLITSTSCVMSEVGNYGNFFRTSVVALLDSDRIDATVDTTKAIELEFATYLEDSLMLFSDKAQFKLEGGNILSPSNVQISQTSAYEINKNVRPIFSNNKLFFCAKRGDYTAVMQYYVDGNGRVSEAIDISSHIEKYIPQDVRLMSASPINNMLFLYAPSMPDTIFVYKYLDSSETRVQSAWFKWQYSGYIYSMFSLGKNLNIMIQRTDIDDSTITYNQFEIQPIHPIDYSTTKYIDSSNIVPIAGTIDYLIKTSTSSSLKISCNIPVSKDVLIYEFDTNTSGTKRWTITLSDSTIITSSSDVAVIPRAPQKSIVEISLDLGLEADGYEFRGLVAKYFDSSNNLLYNGTFVYDYSHWTFTNWTVIEKKKDKGYNIDCIVSLGEWVLKSGDKALTRGTLQYKTIQVNSEEGSDFFVTIEDIKRGSRRNIASKYTVGRKPMVYGNSKNIRVHIENKTDKGFRINSVSLEGNYNSRSRRI